MSKYLDGFLSSIAFFTIIPSGKHNITKYTVNFIAITGIITGIISGFFYYIINPFSRIIASVLAIIILILLYGFNHFDSILDFGDSLMVRGFEKKQQVIKDKYTGSGGIGLFFIVYLMSISLLTYFKPLTGFFIIISGEIVSKYVTFLSMKNAQAFNNGLGNIFIEKIKESKSAIYFNSILLILPLLFNIYNIIIIAITVLIMLALKFKISKSYHGINGDIIGSLGEIGRTVFYLISFIFIIMGLNIISFSVL